MIRIMTTNYDALIEKVVAAAGGWRALGRALGIKYQAIQTWKKIPAERVLAIEHATGIPRQQLRPDLYGEYKPQRAKRLAKEV